MIRRDKNSLLRIFGVKKKIEFLIIQTLVDVYVSVVVISWIRPLSTRILIYSQRDDEIDSSFHSNRFKNVRTN
ncbi:DNA-directed RNA polymerase subunit beta'' [Phtheirospermum japonicum]|uniref:DNA-directed RNA polymerase subunit beta n=1 Tax=Phtheirospermum japonicum TaxID=374723 RepID=A0A830CHS2_9LAMI|nr:DNA-directed RNA polymerase subunit beta'' [Phtheirospermum japonicum]